jgi:hypothetical protein
VSNRSPANLENTTSSTQPYEINYYIRTSLGHVTSLFKIYQQHKPININRSNLTRYQCDKRFIPSIQTNKTPTPLCKKDNIDWNAIFNKEINFYSSYEWYNGQHFFHISKHQTQYKRTTRIKISKLFLIILISVVFPIPRSQNIPIVNLGVESL